MGKGISKNVGQQSEAVLTSEISSQLQRSITPKLAEYLIPPLTETMGDAIKASLARAMKMKVMEVRISNVDAPCGVLGMFMHPLCA